MPKVAPGSERLLRPEAQQIAFTCLSGYHSSTSILMPINSTFISGYGIVSSHYYFLTMEHFIAPSHFVLARRPTNFGRISLLFPLLCFVLFRSLLLSFFLNVAIYIDSIFRRHRVRRDEAASVARLGGWAAGCWRASGAGRRPGRPRRHERVRRRAKRASARRGGRAVLATALWSGFAARQATANLQPESTETDERSGNDLQVILSTLWLHAGINICCNFYIFQCIVRARAHETH